MQRRLDPETGVKKIFELFLSQGRIQKFFQGGGTNFLHFSSLSNENDSRGVRGHAPRKNFENLHTAMAILVLFEQFLRKVCRIFGP